MRSIYTPREEVLLNQAVQSGGLKPDRTTTQAAPAKPAPVSITPTGREPGASLPTNPERFKRTLGPIPAPAPLTPAQAADPAVSAKYNARAAEVDMFNRQRAIEATQGRQTGAGQMVRPRIGGNGRDAVALAVATPARGLAPTTARPAAAPAAAPDAITPAQGPATRPVIAPGQAVGQPPAPAAPVATQAGPAYAVPAYRGPAFGQPPAANIAGGLPQDEIIRRMRSVVGDSAFKGSPSARREMLAAYGAMLGAQDTAALQREKGGMELQQTGVQGQVQGALELQRGLTRRGETAFAQEGAEKLEAMRQDAPTQITASDGTTLLRRGLKADAVLGPDGKPVKQQQPNALTANPRLTALMKLKELDAANRMPGEPVPTNDPVTAAINQELGLGGESDIPAGYTLAGTTKDGKRVFKDASGKTFIE